MSSSQRPWLCFALAFGSPCVATTLTISAVALLKWAGLDDGDGPAGAVVVFGNWALAVIGTAAAGMITPIRSIAAQVAIACLLAPAGFIAYWVMTAFAALLFFGF